MLDDVINNGFACVDDFTFGFAVGTRAIVTEKIRISATDNLFRDAPQRTGEGVTDPHKAKVTILEINVIGCRGHVGG